MIQAIAPAIPIGLFAGAVATAVFASGWLHWVGLAVAILLSVLTVNGLRGMVWLFRNAGALFLIYDDRLVFQRGSDVRDVRWDGLDVVHLHTQGGDGTFYYPLGHPNKLSLLPGRSRNPGRPVSG